MSRHLYGKLKRNAAKLIEGSTQTILMALVFAFIIVSFALSHRQRQENETNDQLGNQSPIYRVQKNDHVIGNPKKARVVLINYSDTECPYCKREFFDFQALVKEHMDDVAIVYRHSAPQVGRFKNSFTQAKALECAAVLRDEDTFWSYLDLIYRTTGSHDGLTYEALISLGRDVGINKKDLEQCIVGNKDVAKKVEWDTQAGVLSGLQIVPSTVLLWADSRDVTILEGLAYSRIIASLSATSSK